MGDGFIVARDLGDRTHAGEPVFGPRTNADPSPLDPRILQSRNYLPDTLQQVRVEGVFRFGEVGFELPINGAVVYENVSWAVRTDVDPWGVQDPPEGISFHSEAQEQTLARLERQPS